MTKKQANQVVLMGPELARRLDASQQELEQVNQEIQAILFGPPGGEIRGAAAVKRVAQFGPLQTRQALLQAQIEQLARRCEEAYLPDLRARIESVACYRSQIGVLFGSRDEMAARIRAYAERLASPGAPGAERLWRPVV